MCAFGTFWKKISDGAKNIARKVVPIVQRGLSAVEKYSKPISDVVQMIPGAGGVASGIRTAGEYARIGNKFIDKMKGVGQQRQIVGADGHGQRAITADNFAAPHYLK